MGWRLTCQPITGRPRRASSTGRRHNAGSLMSSPTDRPPGPPLDVGWIADEVGQATAIRSGGAGRRTGSTVAITEASPETAAHEMRAGDPEQARMGAAVEPPFGVDVLDRLSQRLTMAGLRLASLRRRLAGVEDRMMLIQASDDLDEAIAEVRRLALTVRGSR